MSTRVTRMSGERENGEGKKKGGGEYAYMDVEVGGGGGGRLYFELFYDKTPKTAQNFKALCTGEKGTSKHTGKALCYKGSVFHRIIKGFMIQGGDTTHLDGRGGESIYGENFEDEDFSLEHSEKFLLSMANCGPNSNGSQFFITLSEAKHLDGKHVIFGRLVSGFDTARQIEDVEVLGETPKTEVKIKGCGTIDTIPQEDPEHIPYSPLDIDGPKDVKSLAQHADTLRCRGNEFYKKGKLTEAKTLYIHSLRYLQYDFMLPDDPDDKKFLDSARVKTLLNLAACELKLDNAQQALEHCEEVLTHHPKSQKALYRKAHGLELSGMYSKALQTLNQGATNPSIESKKRVILTKLKTAQAKLSNGLRKAFNKTSKSAKS
ncbi:hypothetical protein AAMO2058_000443000 [Amorphochlora amoebiformis]